MIDAYIFGNELKSLGYKFYAGVPCSFLKSLINYAINDCRYINATNEGDAISIAAGCYLTGNKAVVLMQNSGLTNAVSPLTSLLYTFKIPVLGFVSLRGELGVHDEPQHELMGQITTDMLTLMEVDWEYLSDDINSAREQLKKADRILDGSKPFFFVVKKNTFAEIALKKKEEVFSFSKKVITKTNKDQIPQRFDTLKIISRHKDIDTALFATTGKTGRELYDIEDTGHNLYMVGSMGCIGSLGLGTALNAPSKNIIVIDGDGSLLMRSGSLATIAKFQPDNYLHILLDNNTYDSTGGQETVASNVDFVSLAQSNGFNTSIYCHNLDELDSYIGEWKKKKGLCFMYLRISKGSKKDLGRPSIKPYQVKDRIMKFLSVNPNTAKY
ncbi:MAG: phosphonopyruvate decarboxylase [Stygiobacter sp. RIFOXYC2_FULL_38_25]|nr:MAG: phosphonopyruvate decarboxylase [Stygiobacter sp. RIFOXYC2_FULL_38_25]OGV17913.1 MAG: phosphonopyruvate decarboxylase [Stygiobacter sp. RIFOXYA2_FULL_38_8]OGV79565.1 MAG: phosphonopyruvate decarboxylase [Stygiobacter sp. GWF2_38_21]